MIFFYDDRKMDTSILKTGYQLPHFFKKWGDKTKAQEI
jgi:hypothetical protein